MSYLTNVLGQFRLKFFSSETGAQTILTMNSCSTILGSTWILLPTWPFSSNVLYFYPTGKNQPTINFIFYLLIYAVWILEIFHCTIPSSSYPLIDVCHFDYNNGNSELPKYTLSPSCGSAANS